MGKLYDRGITMPSASVSRAQIWIASHHSPTALPMPVTLASCETPDLAVVVALAHVGTR